MKPERLMNKSIRAICVLTIVVAAAAAHAEAWPSRLIKATIPFGAGSAADVVPRLVFDRLAIELGQPIVIENRAGAGGTIGTGMVAKADPDGYSILSNSNALTITPAIFSNLPYDVGKDLASVFMIGSAANVMIVPNARPWKTIQEFIADAKAKPGSISFGSVGIGSAVHISSEKFLFAAGIAATHIPYRGGSEVIADILGGRIDFYFCPLATALPLIREGQVRALVVSTAKRVDDLPDVPTPVDIGLKDADSAIWFGVFVPSKTPRDIVEKLRAAGEKVLGDKATQENLKKLGLEPMPMTPAEMDDLVKRETAANIELVKAAGIKP
jgi:tripartite-type tricarboxylate transporter receptor subunit TctC